MKTLSDISKNNKSQSAATNVSQQKSFGQQAFQFVDNRPEAIQMRQMQALVNNSDQTKQAAQFQALANNYSAPRSHPIQQKEDSPTYSKGPAQMKVLPFIQKKESYIAPSQKRSLPQKAWHVTQQKNRTEGLPSQFRRKAAANVNSSEAPIQTQLTPLNRSQMKTGVFTNSAMEDAMIKVREYNGLQNNSYAERYILLKEIESKVDDWIIRYSSNTDQQIKTYVRNASGLRDEVKRDLLTLPNAETLELQGWVHWRENLSTLAVTKEEIGVASPAQLTAIRTTILSQIPLKEKGRAITLIMEPDKTQQGYFGTCGLISIIRGTLLTNPSKFVEWAIAAMAKADTLLRSKTRWTENRNEARRKNQRDEPTYEVATLDYFMAQWMIAEHLEAPAAEGGQNSAEEQRLHTQERFSDRLGLEAKKTDWKAEGHYGLDGEALENIAKRMLGDNKAVNVPIDRTPNADGFFNAWNAASANNRLVIASTTGASAPTAQEHQRPNSNRWTQPQETNGFLGTMSNANVAKVKISTAFQPDLTNNKPRVANNQVNDQNVANRRVAFDHWVMLDSVTAEQNGYKVVLWSWGKKQTFHFTNGIAESYFHSLVGIDPNP